MFLIESPLLSIIFLAGSFLLTYCTSSLIYLGKFRSKELAASLLPSSSFFKLFLRLVFPKNEWESLYFSLVFATQVYQLGFLAFAFSFFSPKYPHLTAGISILLSLFFINFLAHLAASTKRVQLIRALGTIASFYLALLSPLIYPFLKLRKTVEKGSPKSAKPRPPSGERLTEMIRDSELHHHLELPDQKLIGAFIKFKERVAKEIMVPRVDLFALSASTTIREASSLFSQEGYSRIPVYKETLDQIVGVVLYKDLLKCFTDPDQNLDATLETIFKPVLYSPENKKVSQLLQEFRTKQIHMAIIVDEYGGTEGVATIEDILEELVGEIEDEYDVDEENPFLEIPGGGWIIDAKMTLLDIADQIGVHLPTHPAYDTLGGYVYHCAGTIPNKGWRFSHDKFDLEVVLSNERAIKKIKIQPRQNV